MSPWAWTILGAALGAGVATVVCVAVGRRLGRRTVRRARAAEQRAQSAERLAEIGALTGGLAHEIKNPLSTINLNAQLLDEAVADLPIDPAERTRLSRRLGNLSREVERLRDILQDFLDFAGELRIEPRPHDLNAVVDELIDFYTPQAERSGVRLRAQLSPEPVHALIDPAHFKQAVLNLMLNAVQAMESAGKARADGPIGELILRTGVEPDDEGRRMATLHVADTGPGIAEDRREAIFKPYFTTRPGGSGLGLLTTRRIVEAHGGRIRVHSEPGRGTDFVVDLPRPDPDEAAERRRGPASAAPAERSDD